MGKTLLRVKEPGEVGGGTESPFLMQILIFLYFPLTAFLLFSKKLERKNNHLPDFCQLESCLSSQWGLKPTDKAPRENHYLPKIVTIWTQQTVTKTQSVSILCHLSGAGGCFFKRADYEKSLWSGQFRGVQLQLILIRASFGDTPWHLRVLIWVTTHITEFSKPGQKSELQWLVAVAESWIDMWSELQT